MPARELSDAAIRLAEEAVSKLDRWLVLYESRLADAEAQNELAELKEFTACLTALKRALEIARIAEVLRPDDDSHSANPLDPEALRQILSEED